METIFEDIRGSKNHQLFLGVVVVLMVLSAIWKFSGSGQSHVSVRQQQIEQATSGFTK